MKNYFSMKAIFFLALFLRIFAAFFFGDKNLDHEFDVLARNIVFHSSYSYWNINELGLLSNVFSQNPQQLIPSAYMPVLYPLFLSFASYLFGFNELSILIILIFQSFLGAYTCIILQKIYNIKFDNDKLNISAFVLSLFPLHIFMSSQISASNLYIFLFVLVIYFYNKICNSATTKKIEFIKMGITLGLLVISRSDTILLLPIIAFLFYFFHKVSIKHCILFLLVASVFIAPISLRNNHHFGFYYPLTIVNGLALWCGNNTDATGSRYNYVTPETPIPNNIVNEVNSLEIDNMYEVNRDNIFFQEAKDFMIENPFRVVQLSIKKFIFFWIHIYDNKINYPGNNNILNWLPWITLLVFFIPSLKKLFSRIHKNDFEIFCLAYFSLVYSVFFVLPRYRLIILPIIILYSAYWCNKNLTILKEK